MYEYNFLKLNNHHLDANQFALKNENFKKQQKQACE